MLLPMAPQAATRIAVNIARSVPSQSSGSEMTVVIFSTWFSNPLYELKII